MSADSIRSRVLRGSVWGLGGYGVVMLIRLASNVALARLLFPEAFGLMALVAVLMQGLRMFSDFGLQASVVQNSRGDDRAFLNTAWTLPVIRGFALWLIATALALPFATAYDQPDLLWMVPIAALAAVISGFNSTALLTANRHIRVGKLVVLEIIAQIVSVTVMVSIALVHPSVWALIAGGLTSSLVVLALSHLWLADTPNRFTIERDALRALIHFGKWIFLSTLLTFLVGEGDKLIFGKLFPIELLGVYAIAVVFALIPAEIIGQLGNSIIFPAYCRMLDRGGDFRARFLSVRLPVVALGMIAISMMALIAPWIIHVLYDDRYSDAGWILQILLAGVAIRILESTNGLALLALGNARIVAMGSLAKLVAMIILIYAGFTMFGIPGAIAGYAASECARYAVSIYATRRASLGAPLWDLPIIVAWLVLTGSGIYVSQHLASSGHHFTLATAIAALGVGSLWVPVAILWLWRHVGSPTSLLRLLSRQ